MPDDKLQSLAIYLAKKHTIDPNGWCRECHLKGGLHAVRCNYGKFLKLYEEERG